MDRQQRRGQQGHRTPDHIAGQRKRGHQQGHAERGGHEPAGRLPVANHPLQQADNRRIQRVEQRVERAAGRLELPGDRDVADAVGLDHADRVPHDESQDQGQGQERRQRHQRA